MPEEITSKFYGCGTPLPLGVTGLRVLDLGSGTGRDCYVAARLVGETGSVTGVHAGPVQRQGKGNDITCCSYSNNQDVLHSANPSVSACQTVKGVGCVCVRAHGRGWLMVWHMRDGGRLTLHLAAAQ